MTSWDRHLRALEQFSICQVADAFGPSCKLETAIRPVHPHFRICGPAFTVACAPGDNLTLHHALHLANAGQVLVASGGKSCRVALWGELMSRAARKKGLRGTIIDGAVRDFWEVKALGYPLFARGLTPRRASKEKYGSIGTPIRCGNLTVRSGDIILADMNGILAIPADQLEDAVRLARGVLKKEAAAKKEIARGRTLLEILGLETQVPIHRGITGNRMLDGLTES